MTLNFASSWLLPTPARTRTPDNALVTTTASKSPQWSQYWEWETRETWVRCWATPASKRIFTLSFNSISRLTYNIPERDLELQVFQNAFCTGTQSLRGAVDSESRWKWREKWEVCAGILNMAVAGQWRAQCGRPSKRHCEVLHAANRWPHRHSTHHSTPLHTCPHGTTPHLCTPLISRINRIGSF